MQLGECSANPQTEAESPTKRVDTLFLLDKRFKQPTRQHRIKADTAVFDPKNGIAAPETTNAMEPRHARNAGEGIREQQSLTTSPCVTQR